MITREKLEELVDKQLSISEISKIVKLSNTTIRYWLKKFNLKTKANRYLQHKYKFSDEELITNYNKSVSYNDFMINLGVTNSGGAFYHYKKRLKNLGLLYETKNFRNIGNKISANRQLEAGIAHNKSRNQRSPRKTLKIIMDNAKIPYYCIGCGISKWFEKPLKLHIHHIDRNKVNNIPTNLAYLCPNCHSMEHN